MKNSHGNMLFYILICILLIGVLVATLRGMGDQFNADMSGEKTIVSVSQALKYAKEVESGVQTILQNGASETDIRFANVAAPSDYGDITVNPQYQVFSSQGGAVKYQLPPSSIFASAGLTWEFAGNVRMYQVGTDKADLVAVIPYITQSACNAINRSLGLGTSITVSASADPADTANRFVGTYNDATPITASFSPALGATTNKPYPSLCATYSSSYFYVHTLLAR